MKKSSLEEMMSSALSGAENTGEGNFKSLVNVTDPNMLIDEERENIIIEETSFNNEVEHINNEIEYNVPKVEETQETKIEEVKTIVNNNFITTEIVDKIINIYNVYIEQTQEAKQTIKTFLEINENAKPSAIVQSILELEETQSLGLQDLFAMRKSDPLDVAFGLIELSTNRLEKLNEIVAKFLPNYENNYFVNEKTKYCRNLAKGIMEIPETIIDRLIPINSLLQLR